MSRTLLTRAGLIIAPAVAAAGVIIGGAIATAQEGGSGAPTPAPDEQTTPGATPKSRGDGSDCPNKGGDGGQSDTTTTNSGV